MDADDRRRIKRAVDAAIRARFEAAAAGMRCVGCRRLLADDGFTLNCRVCASRRLKREIRVRA
jgi:hypothetical protein